MKKLIYSLVILALPILANAQNRAVIDKIVGTIGNELVLLSDVEEQYDLLEKQKGVLPEGFRCIILENLLAEKLLLNQSKLDSIEVTAEEVEAQLQARIDQILAYMNNDIQQFEDYYGQSISEVKESFRQDLENQLLVQRMRSKIVSEVKITPSEVKKFFSQIEPDSLPYFNSEVEIGEIVYNPKVSDEQNELSKAKLEKIRKRIVEDGEDFAELAKKYSHDPGSGRLGGDLGMQRRGTFVTEFEAAAYNLTKDEISEVIQTEFGFHIIQLLDRRGNNIHARHILIKPEITEADLDLAVEKLNRIKVQLQKDSISFSKAVKLYSDENIPSYNNDGDLQNPKTGKTVFETGDLEPEIYFTIDTMEVRDISAPIQFLSQSGEIAFRLIYLKSRTAPHKANLQLDYSKIKAAAIEQKTNQIVSDWVYDKIGSTFIEIDPLYHSCDALEKWLRKEEKP
jgi:peptidyl-prolyl cis-trans isomerase SurA